MHSSNALSVLALMAAAASTAVAKTIEVDVGKSGLTFSPNTIMADVGDVVEFHFFSNFHTAVEGDFSTPCHRGSGGFASGSINNMANGTPNVFQVTITDTNPKWFYCSTPSHCQSGMVGVINPPSSGNSLATYKSAAASTSDSEAATLQGGVVVAIGSSPSASPSSGSSSAAAAGSSSAAAAGSSSAAAAGSSSTAAAGSSSATSAASSVASTSAAPASTAASSGSSAAGGAMTTAASSAASSAASTTPTIATKSGASSLHSLIFAAQSTLVVVGLGLLVFFIV